MIIKTSQRSGAAWLATHLTRADTNESVRIIDGRGVIALDVHVALRQFEAQWRLSNSRARDFLIHAAISPAQPLSEAQWAEAWEIYERQHVLLGQPYIEVEHAKPGDTGRPSHRHRAYLRVRPDGRAVHLGHSFQTNEVVARVCELRFGHAVTKGAHNRAVVNYLERNGYGEDADRLRRLTERRRPRAGRSEAEAQQESRAGCRKAAAAELAAAAWRCADGPQARRTALADAGFALARGDRRDTVLAVDAGGESWALHRLLAAGERGAWTAARVRRDLEGVLDALPSIEELRRSLRAAATQEPPQVRCEEAGRLPGAPVSAPTDHGAPPAPDPAFAVDADAYWLTEPDDAIPTLPTPTPVVCRLGADASVPEALDAAGHGDGADVEDADGPPMAPPRSTAAPSASPAFGAAAMTPPPDGWCGTAPGARPPPTTDRVERSASRKAGPTVNGERRKVEAPPPDVPPSGTEAPRNDPAPARDGPAGRNGEGTEAKRRLPARAPVDGRGSGRPPPSRGARRWPPPPPAPSRSERDDDWIHGPRHPSFIAQQEEARRRKAHDDKAAARRIRELKALETRRSAPVAMPSASRLPDTLDHDIAGRIRTYVGALLDWWGARLGRADHGIGGSLRRLDQAWRALVAATRLRLRRQRRSDAVEDVCEFLTRAVARDHAEARQAHDRWLDRTYQPAAARVHGTDHASLSAQRAGDGMAPRSGEAPERAFHGE